MHIIVGLGNPGSEYEHTRHNAGFDAIDVLAHKLGANYWKTQCGALVAKCIWQGHELLLAKPQSYMNASGGPIKQLLNEYGAKIDELIVIHDELDIEPGSLRIKFGGGHAGHNGLRSICDKLGTRDWYRIRIGIGRPTGHMQVVDWVLSKPKRDCLDSIYEGIEKASDAALSLVDKGLEKTQQEYN